MNTFRRWWQAKALTILFITMSNAANAQGVDEEISPIDIRNSDEVEAEIRTRPEANIESASQRQPITKAELEAAYGSEALAIMNEQLRQEIELLAREYRESERRNDIQLFGLGAIIALIFLGIGFSIGKRFGGRRLL